MSETGLARAQRDSELWAMQPGQTIPKLPAVEFVQGADLERLRAFAEAVAGNIETLNSVVMGRTIGERAHFAGILRQMAREALSADQGEAG